MKNKLTFENVLHMYNTVVDWNKLGGNSVKDKSLSKIYHSLTMEEYFDDNEFLDGYKTHNSGVELDGICDMVYVGFYWAAVNGMDEMQLKDLFEHAEICYDFGGATLNGTVALMDKYLTGNDPFMFVKELMVLMMLRMKNYDILSAFEEVSRSNNSKYPLVVDVENPEKEVKFITGQGRYGGVVFKEVDGRYVFLAKEDVKKGVVFDKMKVVKCSLFSDVQDLTRFVY